MSSESHCFIKYIKFSVWRKPYLKINMLYLRASFYSSIPPTFTNHLVCSRQEAKDTFNRNVTMSNNAYIFIYQSLDIVYAVFHKCVHFQGKLCKFSHYLNYYFASSKKKSVNGIPVCACVLQGREIYKWGGQFIK